MKFTSLACVKPWTGLLTAWVTRDQVLEPTGSLTSALEWRRAELFIVRVTSEWFTGHYDFIFLMFIFIYFKYLHISSIKAPQLLGFLPKSLCCPDFWCVLSTNQVMSCKNIINNLVFCYNCIWNASHSGYRNSKNLSLQYLSNEVFLATPSEKYSSDLSYMLSSLKYKRRLIFSETYFSVSSNPWIFSNKNYSRRVSYWQGVDRTWRGLRWFPYQFCLALITIWRKIHYNFYISTCIEVRVLLNKTVSQNIQNLLFKRN